MIISLRHCVIISLIYCQINQISSDITNSITDSLRCDPFVDNKAMYLISKLGNLATDYQYSMYSASRKLLFNMTFNFCIKIKQQCSSSQGLSYSFGQVISSQLNLDTSNLGYSSLITGTNQSSNASTTSNQQNSLNSTNSTNQINSTNNSTSTINNNTVQQNNGAINQYQNFSQFDSLYQSYEQLFYVPPNFNITQNQYSNISNIASNCSQLTNLQNTSAIGQISQTIQINDFQFAALNLANYSQGIKVFLVHNVSTAMPYSLEMHLYCVQYHNENFDVTNLYLKDNATILFRANSIYACPSLDLSQTLNWIYANAYICSAVLCIFGLVELLGGLPCVKFTLFIIGFISCFFLFVIIGGEYVLNPLKKVSPALKILFLLFNFVLSIVSGYFITKIYKVGIFALGIWLGILISIALNGAFLYKIQTNPPNLVLWIAMAVLGLIGGLLSLKFWKKIVILATSFIGAYCVVRSVSLLLGGFPDELNLIDNGLSQASNAYFLYFALIILLWVFGIVYQIRKDKEQMELTNSNRHSYARSSKKSDRNEVNVELEDFKASEKLIEK